MNPLKNSFAERRQVLTELRRILIDPALDNGRKVLRSLDLLDMEIRIATAQEKAVAGLHEASDEDGGYEDRDPLVNAVKGDLP